MTSSTMPLKTVIRAFKVIDILQERHKAGPSEVAEELGVTRATAHDYLVSLEEAGYASKNDGSYQVGYRFLQEGNRVKYRQLFFQAALTPLEDLHSSTEELAQIGLEENGEWVLLHAEGNTTKRGLGAYPGHRTPLHTHAAGKVLLAEMPLNRVDEVLEDNLEAKTEHTVTDPSVFRQELDQVREDKYCVDWDQQTVEIGFVACPVICDDQLLGSVSVSTPSGRLQNEEDIGDLIQHVKTAAAAISINYRQRLKRGVPRTDYS